MSPRRVACACGDGSCVLCGDTGQLPGGDDVFVANADGTFTCPECIPEGLDLGDQRVETWRCFSDGWTSVPTCRECGVAIPVFVTHFDGVYRVGTMHGETVVFGATQRRDELLATYPMQSIQRLIVTALDRLHAGEVAVVARLRIWRIS